MTQSESIKELAAALAKAQAEITTAKKDSTNPHFKSKYADLASVWDAIRAPLTKHGLSVAQFPGTTETGAVSLTTVLMHSSGEWMSGVVSVKPSQDTNPQVYGSILTYLRRYALQSAVGIAADDDDGNAGAGKPVAQVAEPARPALNPETVKAFAEAQNIEEVSLIWKTLDVGIRHAYAEVKDAAKARVGAAA